jgi:hypothetical protein
MPSPPVVLHRGTQSIPSTVKADLLFTQGMIPGERRCGEKEFFLFNSVVIAPLAPPPRELAGALTIKQPRKFSSIKAIRDLAPHRPLFGDRYEPRER